MFGPLSNTTDATSEAGIATPWYLVGLVFINIQFSL
jgi:hypothetical protein